MVHTTLSKVIQTAQSEILKVLRAQVKGQRTLEILKVLRAQIKGQGTLEILKVLKSQVKEQGALEKVKIPGQRTGNIDINAFTNSLGQRTRQQSQYDLKNQLQETGNNNSI